MIPTLSPVARRLLALLILVLLVGVAAAAVWLPFGILRQQDAALAELSRTGRELDQRVRQRDQLLAEQRLLQRASEADQTLIQAATPALAAAELQRELTDLVRDGGGLLDSVQVLEPMQTPPFVQVALRVSFTVQLDGLRSFLYAIEQHAPVLLVRELSVSETVIYGETDDSTRPALSAVVEVLGYARANLAS
jgi:hypothetical protein